jgi:hypothetical protein
MTRYEDMDDLILRLQGRLGQPEQASEDGIRALAPGAGMPPASGAYDEAVEQLVLTLRDAQACRLLFTPDRICTLPHQERDELLTILGQVLQELWSCESALQRVAPYD